MIFYGSKIVLWWSKNIVESWKCLERPKNENFWCPKSSSYSSWGEVFFNKGAGFWLVALYRLTNISGFEKFNSMLFPCGSVHRGLSRPKMAFWRWGPNFHCDSHIGLRALVIIKSDNSSSFGSFKKKKFLEMNIQGAWFQKSFQLTSFVSNWGFQYIPGWELLVSNVRHPERW